MTAGVPRVRVVKELLRELLSVRPGERALVAIDGFDGVGKSHLASELVSAAWEQDRPLLSLTIDRFHHPKAERVAAGRDAEGFYRGSYRYDEFRRCVVDPVRSGTPLTPAIWDVAADEPIHAAPVTLAGDTLVIVDGIFLQRPELADVWDATVWVDAPFEVTVPRGNLRYPGDPADLDPAPFSPMYARYVGGQGLYLAEADPVAHSTWVFDNTELDNPKLTRA